jgi:hypothetical protein
MTTLSTLSTEPRHESQEAFAERLLEVLNAGGLALMISVGHRTGLFDAMAGLPPSTSEEVARHAGNKSIRMHQTARGCVQRVRLKNLLAA